MPRESMDKYAERRTAELQAKAKAKRDGPAMPKRGKDSPDSKGPSVNAWKANTNGKMKREK